jgi:hypothetical protein
MTLISLMGFITVMWIMVLVVAAFLTILVPRLDIILLGNGYNRLTVSTIEAVISILAVVLLIFVLSSMKKYYMQKKLRL